MIHFSPSAMSRIWPIKISTCPHPFPPRISEQVDLTKHSASDYIRFYVRTDRAIIKMTRIMIPSSIRIIVFLWIIWSFCIFQLSMGISCFIWILSSIPIPAQTISKYISVLLVIFRELLWNCWVLLLRPVSTHFISIASHSTISFFMHLLISS